MSDQIKKQLRMSGADVGCILALSLLLAAVVGLAVGGAGRSDSSWLTFLPLIAFPFVAWLVIDLRTALFIMVVWIPIELWLSKDLQIISQTFTLLDEGILVLITAGWILRVAIGKKKIHWTPLDLPIIAFFLVGIVSALVNQVPLISVVLGFRAQLQYILLYYAIVNSTIKEAFFQKLVRVSIFFALIQIPWGIYQVVAKTPLPLDKIERVAVVGSAIRAFGTFVHPNMLGGFLVLFTAIFIGWYNYRHGWRYKNLLVIGMFVILLVLTFSREAWLALFIGVTSIFSLQKRAWKTLQVIIVSVVVFGIAWQLSPGFSARTLSQLRTADEYERYKNALVGADALKTSPVLGVGPGMWGGSAASLLGSPMMEKYGIRTSTADSGWLSLTVEYGFLGSLAFSIILLIMLQMVLKTAYKVENPYWKGVFFGASVFIVGSAVLALVSPAFENQQISFYIWFFAGVSQSLKLNEGQAAHDG